MINFSNIENQHQFERDGYTIIDLLEAEEVDALRAFYFENKANHLVVNDKMHSTSDTQNTSLILSVDKKIKKIIVPKLERALTEFDLLIGGFLVKEPGQGSATGFHQDPTLVDSLEHVSANVWIALQDTNHANGNLSVVKGSHRLGDMMVVTPIFPTIFRDFEKELKYFTTELPIKAGQAIILNNKLIHGASVNQTKEERLAIVLAIKSKSANWSFHYLDPEHKNSKIERFRIDLESFASLKKNNRPENGAFIEYIDFDFPRISFEEFKYFMHDNYGTNALFPKLKRIVAKWRE